MNPYDVWGVKREVAEKASKVHKMKHGLFASVPIICKGSECPYISVCSVGPDDIVEGGRCPLEAAAIVSRFQSWCDHFKIDISDGIISNSDVADVSLIKDLVENEVQTIRAENRIAMNADFIAKTIVEIDKFGNVYKENAVTPEAEYKLALQDKRYKILQLLSATRKDKTDVLNKANSAADAARSIFAKISEKLNIDVDNLEFDEEGVVDNGKC